MPRTAIQTWRDFASAMADERDPHKVADLVKQLNHDLSEIDGRPQAAVIAINGSDS